MVIDVDDLRGKIEIPLFESIKPRIETIQMQLRDYYYYFFHLFWGDNSDGISMFCTLTMQLKDSGCNIEYCYLIQCIDFMSEVEPST